MSGALEKIDAFFGRPLVIGGLAAVFATKAAASYLEGNRPLALVFAGLTLMNACSLAAKKLREPSSSLQGNNPQP